MKPQCRGPRLQQSKKPDAQIGPSLCRVLSDKGLCLPQFPPIAKKADSAIENLTSGWAECLQIQPGSCTHRERVKKGVREGPPARITGGRGMCILVSVRRICHSHGEPHRTQPTAASSATTPHPNPGHKHPWPGDTFSETLGPWQKMVPHLRTPPHPQPTWGPGEGGQASQMGELSG